ncbi:MAG TPA: SH3 domain-containing protein [Verrucomicrobiae bacterium]|nr:SH3 domain-containing protein [Verrucomicrobiae bacterium]
MLQAALMCAALALAQSARADVGLATQPVALAASETGHGTVKAGRCNVRSRPSLNAEVVVQLHKGDAIDVLERKSVTEHGKPMDWLRIPLPAAAKCFVSAKFLTDGVVNVDDLYARCGPGSNYRDIGKLAKGTKVDVVETKGAWTQIKPTPECNGWIAAELVEVEPAAAPVAAPAPAASLSAPEVVTPPVAVAGTTPAPAAPSTEAPAVSVVNIDPDVQVQYVVKDGYLWPVTASNAPAAYELRTAEVDRISYRIAYLELSETNLKKYEGKHVRVMGNQRWRKGDRDPVIVVERLDRVW